MEVKWWSAADHVFARGRVQVDIPRRPRGPDVKRILLPIRIASLVAISACSLLNGNEHASGQIAQQPGAQQRSVQTRIRVNSNLAILPVTVKDRNGNLVGDMERGDFQVFDDNVEQTIDIFTAEAFPLSMVVLVDDDLKSRDASALVASLRTVTAGISTEDEAMVCHFDLEFYPGEKFTSDEDALLAELKSAQSASGPSQSGPVPFVISPSTHPRGVGEPIGMAGVNMGSRPTKALDDAVYAAAQLLHGREGSRRRIILLITDGLNGEEFNHHTYEQTMELLLHDNVAIYSLAVGSDSFQKKFARMRDYANGSGGDIFYAAKSDAMEKLYSQMTEQARHEYTLAYAPKGNNTKSDYHVVRVSTTRGGMQVQTRKGYYANGLSNPMDK